MTHKERTAPTLGYLSRLVQRLDARSFPADDRLYVAALKAQAAMSELVMTLHYMTCDGVGGPARATTTRTTQGDSAE